MGKQKLVNQFTKSIIMEEQRKNKAGTSQITITLITASLYVKRYKKRWCIETIYRITDKIRIYTTSTNCIIGYFLFMLTCFVYNIWRFLQMFLGEDFTLANHKTNMIIFMAKHGMIYPKH